MALPKVNTPTYELKIPSTGQKVKYRPFLVKEEKLLLMALEDGNPNTMSKAMKDIISACTEGELKLKDLASFDIEYFFLQLRGKSVGDILELTFPKPYNIKCGEENEHCVETCTIKINVDDINVDSTKIKDSKIELTDSIGIKMNYPQFEALQKFSNITDDNATSNDVFKIINECKIHVPEETNLFSKKLINENNKKISIIGELKRSSPSAGNIVDKDIDLIKIAKEYEKNGISCISILTDEKYFD